MKFLRGSWTLLLLSALLVGGMPLAAQAYETFTGPMGLLKHNKEKAFQSYTLFTPSTTNFTYLIDMDAQIINKWEAPSSCVYAELLPNGNILRTRREENSAMPPTFFGGESGIIEEVDWNGKVVWSFRLYSPTNLLHGAFTRLPNGNTLINCLENKTREEAFAKGRKPESLLEAYPHPLDPNMKITGMWPGYIVEVDPSGKVVWEWHAWDHIGTGPDQLDINFHAPAGFNPNFAGPDWTHYNSVRYVPDRDMIILNSRNFSEFYFIDHKTGKIIYRYGNPGAYGQGRLPGGYGDNGDQILFGPHDVRMLPTGNITLFDNGTARPSGPYSRVIELNPETNKIVWQFFPGNPGFAPNSFYSVYQSSVQKLPNGNYFVLSSNNGHMFEVTRDKEIVWDFVNPVTTTGIFAALDDGNAFPFAMHKSFRYEPDYPGLKGKDLSPKGPLVPGSPDWVNLLKTNTFTMKAPAAK